MGGKTSVFGIIRKGETLELMLPLEAPPEEPPRNVTTFTGSHPLNGAEVGNLSPAFNIELKVGRGGQICRTAGGAAQLMAREGQYAVVLMPSGELRRIHIECMATIGRVGNTDHQNVKLGKAGRNRHRGRRPKVRGTAMNPVDHPLGGGEGRASGGRPPVTPWGKREGTKTRKRKKQSNKYIIRGRKRGKATQ